MNFYYSRVIRNGVGLTFVVCVPERSLATRTVNHNTLSSILASFRQPELSLLLSNDHNQAHIHAEGTQMNVSHRQGFRYRAYSRELLRNPTAKSHY
jgi:hypothetical protein